MGVAGAAVIGAGLAGWRILRRTRYRGPVKHVVFLSLDTLRPDHLGCYLPTGIRTPAIDALARESILYADNITPVTSTLASHTSMFTGKYPHDHGARRNGFLVPPGNVLLAEVLADAGFHTAAFVGAFPLEHRFGLARGFDHYDERFDLAGGEDVPGEDQRRATAVTRAALGYLDRAGVPENLFLFAHYFDAHLPYAAPEPFGSLYAGSNRAAPDLRRHPILALGGRIPEDVEMIRAYCGEVSYVDFEVGRLLEGLRRRGVLDEALVVLTSDHGEMMGEREDLPLAFSHGWSVYEGELRTALLFRLPGGGNGGGRHGWIGHGAPTSGVDILPTVIRTLGLDMPPGVSGVAFDLFAGGAPPGDRTHFAEATKPWESLDDPSRSGDSRSECARRGKYKFLRRPIDGAEALFDLDRDPWERANRLERPGPEDALIADALRTELVAWRQSARTPASRVVEGEDGSTRDRLRGLGYLK
jgi:arylsulfatase A-like enzyme